MSNNSNARKDATLGMPHGTANGRLRKMIIFNLLKKHDENVCVKCSFPILRIEDLSIEHIKPWEGISAELFWDLDNIAFSHMHCNRPHRLYKGGRPEILVPEGKVWCGVCKSPKDIVDFTDGAKNQCKECKSKLNAQRIR